MADETGQMSLPFEEAAQAAGQGTAKPQGAATGSVQGKGKVNISQTNKGKTTSVIVQLQKELDSLAKQGFDTSWYQSALSMFDRAFGYGQSARQPSTPREQATSEVLGNAIAQRAAAIGQAAANTAQAAAEQKAQAAAEQKAQAAEAAQAAQKAFKKGAKNLTPEEIAELGKRVMKGESLDSVLKSGNDSILLKQLVGKAAQGTQENVAFTDEQMTRLNQMAMDGASPDAMKLQMLRFKMLNDYTNPESDTYKGLTEDVLSEYKATVEAEKAAEEAANQKRVTESLKRFALPGWAQVLQAGAALVGGVASMAGNTSSLYRNGLANALMNVANMGSPGVSAQRKAAFGDPLEGLGYNVAARAQKQKYIGDRNKMIGDTINRVLNQITGGVVAEQQQQRQYRSLLEEHPPGLFYQTNWNWGSGYPNKISKALQ